jgi:magnesium-transporting ATPase (P-type)
LVALRDPIRDNMAKMVQDARAANMELYMVSGDNLTTAAAVACDAGIITRQEFEAVKNGDGNDVAMDATQFRQIVGDVIRSSDDVEDGAQKTTSYRLD